MITPERIAEIEKRCNAATAGDWAFCTTTYQQPELRNEIDKLSAQLSDAQKATEDATDIGVKFAKDARRLEEQLSDAQEAIAANDQNSVLAVTLQNQLNDAQSALRVKDDALQTCLNRMAWVQDVERRTSGTSWEALADAIAIATAALQPGRE